MSLLRLDVSLMVLGLGLVAAGCSSGEAGSTGSAAKGTGGGGGEAASGAGGGGGSASESPARAACLNASDLQALSSLDQDALSGALQQCLLGGLAGGGSPGEAGAGGGVGSGGGRGEGGSDPAGAGVLPVSNPSTCIQESLGLSEACTTCVAELMACTLTSCLVACVDPQTATCQACVAESCSQDFVRCSGLPFPGGG